MTTLTRMISFILKCFGLDGVARRAWNRHRLSPLNSSDRQLGQAHGVSFQYLMDIHPSSHWHNREFASHFGGFFPPGDNRTIVEEPFLHDRVRSDQIILLLRELTVRQVPGAIAELGVHQGASARLLHHYCPERRLYLLDTFTGFAASDLAKETVDLGFNKQQAFTDTTVGLVLERIAPVNANVIPVPGWFPASITTEMQSEVFCFAHLDVDLEEPTKAGLTFFAHRLAPGGFILVHDYNAWPGARFAVDRFLVEQPRWRHVPLVDKSGSVLLLSPSPN